jgi:tryptophanyl-tRNA synthetase
LSREIARRWNARFAPDAPWFPEPQALLTPARRIMGLDGQAKMSKSLGNTDGLLEQPEQIWEKLRPAVTDPKRVRRTDPGTPEVCNIYHLHKSFSAPTVVEDVAVKCSTAGWGCIDCKRVLFESVNRELSPMRERAAEIREHPERVDEVLAEGAERAHALASRTLAETKERMGF